MSQSSSQVRVSAEVEELRSQLSRLNIRNKELEFQNSGRSNDHARMLKQASPAHKHAFKSRMKDCVYELPHRDVIITSRKLRVSESGVSVSTVLILFIKMIILIEKS